MIADWWHRRWRGLIGGGFIMAAIINLPVAEAWPRVGWSILLLLGLDLYILQILQNKGLTK